MFVSRFNINKFTLAVLMVGGALLLVWQTPHDAQAVGIGGSCDAASIDGADFDCDNGLICNPTSSKCETLSISFDTPEMRTNVFYSYVASNSVVGEWDVYSCLGSKNFCQSKAQANTNFWHPHGPNPVRAWFQETGLRPSQSYWVTVRATEHGGVADVDQSGFITLPGLNFKPTDTAIACGALCSRSINFTTAVSGDAKIIYGPNPPTWESDANFTAAVNASAATSMIASDATSTGHLWVGGENGVVLHRTPAGAWSSSSTGGGGWIFSVSAYDDSNVWVSGQGKTYRSINGGASWISVPVPAAIQFMYFYSVVALSPTTAMMLATPVSGTGSYIVYYNGTTWSTIYNGPTALNQMITHGSYDVWAVGKNGVIIHCNNVLDLPSCNWTPMVTNGADELTTVGTADGETVFVGGLSGSGVLYKITTPDHRLTWNTPQYIVAGTTVARIDGIHMVNTQEFWAISERNAIYYKDNPAPSLTVDTSTSAYLPSGIYSLAVVRPDQIVALAGKTLIRYGMPTGSSVANSSGSASFTHSPVLTNLAYGTTYYYAAESPDVLAAPTVIAGSFGGSFTTPPLDTIAPTITLNPVPAYVNGTGVPLTISGTAADTAPGTVTNVQLVLDGGAPIVASGTTNWSVALSDAQLSSQMNHTISVRAFDSVNFSTPATANFIYDKVTPTVTITSASPVTTSTTTASGTATDANDSIAKVEIAVNGGPRSTVWNGTPVASVPWTATGIPLTAAPSTNTIVVFATDRAGNVGTNSTVVVYNAPTFTSTLQAPTSQTVTAGTPASYSIQLSGLNGFNGTVNLSIPTPPAGVNPTLTTSTVTLTPATPTDSTNLIVNSPAGPASGPYAIVVRATYTDPVTLITTTKDVTATLSLNATPDFGVTASPGSRSVTVGTPATYTITVKGTGTYAYDPVGHPFVFSTGTLPTGVTAGFGALSGNPASVAGATSILTLNTTQPVAIGTMIVVNVTDGNFTHSVNVALEATPPADYSITMLNATSSTTAGSGVPAVYNFRVKALNGFTGVVHLALQVTPGDPAIIPTFSTNDFMPASTLNGTDVTLNVIANSNIQYVPACPCNLALQIQGTSTLNRSAAASLTLTPDVTAPVISNPSAIPSDHDVTISWLTNEPADSQITVYADAAMTVAVGTSSDHGTFCTATCHNRTVGGLAQTTTYYYKITSTDQALPTTNTATYVAGPPSFTTTLAPDNTAPVVTITQPPSISVNGTVTILGSGIDDHPMDHLQLRITHGTPAVDVFAPMTIACPAASTNCPLNYQWNTYSASSPNDIYTITVTGYSTRGPATTASASVVVTVANDTTPPHILCLPSQTNCQPEATGLSCTGGTCSILIHWMTDDASTSELEYGLAVDCAQHHTLPDGTIIPCAYTSSQRYDRANPADSSAAYTEHWIQLNGLLADRLYHYRITSCNENNLCTN